MIERLAPVLQSAIALEVDGIETAGEALRVRHVPGIHLREINDAHQRIRGFLEPGEPVEQGDGFDSVDHLVQGSVVIDRKSTTGRGESAYPDPGISCPNPLVTK